MTFRQNDPFEMIFREFFFVKTHLRNVLSHFEVACLISFSAFTMHTTVSVAPTQN